MTNGEKIETILDVDKDCTEVHDENGTMTFTVTQDFWNAEYKESKTDVVDKIRAEIDLETRIQVKHYTNTDAVIDTVLDVIDEYTAESTYSETRCDSYENQLSSLKSKSCDTCGTENCNPKDCLTALYALHWTPKKDN